MTPNPRLYIILEELELELSFEWSYLEYPQIGDSISIVGLCTEAQRSELKAMPIPQYLQPSDFFNVLEYISFHEWVVVNRSWGYCDGFEIICASKDLS